jgi:hypothetical protein
MVHVTNRPDVAVRLRARELFLGHGLYSVDREIKKGLSERLS